MKTMAFIPARGGSKGIPKKNLTLLNGKPLIQYTIEAAQKSKFIDNIFLSSDDSEIIDFSKSLGLKVPYQRPDELAEDTTPMIDTVLHALDWLKKIKGYFPDYILLLQPTSPLRRVEDIDNAIKQFFDLNAKALISVHEMIEHPYECVKLKENNWSFLQKSHEAVYRRQDYIDKYYYINGAIYFANTEFIIKNKSFMVEKETKLYVMPASYGIDVDEPRDLKRCEFFLK